jgi:hypothetical protein
MRAYAAAGVVVVTCESDRGGYIDDVDCPPLDDKQVMMEWIDWASHSFTHLGDTL